jgi:UTP:GlnB (protein PII) uridylyltransferase
MRADDATGTASAWSGRPLDKPLDPWLRMRLAPVRGARRPVVRAGSVRDALHAIASVRPDPALLRLELCRVRAVLDQERTQLRERLAEGVPVAEVARAEARLLDGAILGLCHLGRLFEPAPADIAPPLAVIARGDYGRRKLAPGTVAGLLFLVAGDPVGREHGLAVAQFVARELAGLGWHACGAKRTVPGCLAETHLDPAIPSDLFAARLIWGSRGLFTELRAGLAQVTSRRQSRTIWATPDRSARPVLAA